MRSKASIKGHPIHAALIPFPFVFLVGSLLFDLSGVLLDKPALWATGAHLAIAGVIAALVAAVPGFMDYLHTVPPNSTGKQRATKHMAVNLTAVALFFVVWLLRDGADTAPTMVTLGMSVIGSGLLAAGGWMGGTLAYRNQIGVDHRYADAGKWKEGRVSATKGKAIAVAKADELEPNQMKLLFVDVDGAQRRIVLARTDKGWNAFDDRCTHRGGSLAGGSLACGVVQCPWHGSQFDVESGSVRAGPAREQIALHRVEVSGNEVRLTVL